jgi:Reverse transcriptase (RNA-dependent DNA polymerase)
MVSAHEILHHVKLTKEQGLLLKFEFEKAFDNVDWSYLLTNFQHMGFSPIRVSWMHRLLWEGHSAVILNGSAGPYFECQKRVRQGDPFSSYLFLLVIEGLNKILTLGISGGHFEGLGPILSHY